MLKLYLRIEFTTNDPEAENASDNVLCSTEDVDVDAGGEAPPLERALAPLADCRRRTTIVHYKCQLLVVYCCVSQTFEVIVFFCKPKCSLL